MVTVSIVIFIAFHDEINTDVYFKATFVIFKILSTYLSYQELEEETIKRNAWDHDWLVI